MPIAFLNLPADRGVAELAHVLQTGLQAGPVLWLLSGGSNVAISTEVMQRLPTELTPGLTISLVDERFGPVGHADSNFTKLQAAGFDAKQARLHAVLDNELDLAATAQAYGKWLQAQLASGQQTILQLGIGADGHTAGVLPHSVAVESRELVASYDGPDFRRITLTLAALKRAERAFVFSYGADKLPALQALQSITASLAEQPCQILKHIPSVCLYNDQIGGDT